MNNEQILKKAIEKAEKNGFDNEKHRQKFDKRVGHFFGEYVPFEYVIFSHDFAKAFWGEEGEEISVSDKIRGIELVNRWKKDYWKEHLKRMVLEKEPLKYLEKYL